MTDKIRVVARVNVRPDKLDETLQAFESLVAATRAEDGCITYDVMRNVEDPHDIAFVEEWASAEALDAHFATEHFQAIAARSGELLTAPPDIRRYTIIH
jgi:quinol monooxygenase YgiN